MHGESNMKLKPKSTKMIGAHTPKPARRKQQMRAFVTDFSRAFDRWALAKDDRAYLVRQPPAFNS